MTASDLAVWYMAMAMGVNALSVFLLCATWLLKGAGQVMVTEG